MTDTAWHSQHQTAALFDAQKALAFKQLTNNRADGEVERSATVSRMETVRAGDAP